jgi:hypothetical protein
MGRKKLVAGLVLGVALVALGVAAGATAQRYVATCLRSNSLWDGCGARLEVGFGGAVTPKVLPRDELAPVGFEVHGRIAVVGGGHPSALRETIIDVPEDVGINAAGLPACPRRKLAGSGVAAARRLCRKAIVGSGMAHIGFTSSDAIIESPLTLFNGGGSGGETRLFVHGAIFVPSPMPLIGMVKIQRKYAGLHTTWKLPPILEGDGSLLDFRFKVERRFMAMGAAHSYLAAKCPSGDLLANVPKMLFRNEARTPGVAATTVLKGLVSVPCSPIR